MYRRHMAGPLPDELPLESRRRLLGTASSRTFGPQQQVFCAGDTPAAVFIVETGLIRLDRTLTSGRTVLFTLAAPGDLVGELSLIDGAPRSATATAMTDSSLQVIAAADFTAALAADIALANAMLARITRQLRGLNDRFVEAAAYGATARVASRLVALLDLADGRRPHSGPVELALPITQEELAQWAGLSREGVVKAIGELRASGIVQTGRRRIVIRDPTALRRLADEVG